MCTSFYRGAHIVLVVCDVTDTDSFVSTKRWVEEARHYIDDKCQILLVANKVDMTDTRRVSCQDIVDMAATLGVDSIETSALSAHNVDQAFASSARAYLDT